MKEIVREDSLFLFMDDRTGEEFTLTLRDLLRCLRIAEERFLVPPLGEDFAA